MAGRTDNSVVIHAPMDLVWRMTNDVTSWTTLFTEYANVEVLNRDEQTMRFRLTTHPDENGKVCGWVSERTVDEDTKTVTAHRVETGPFEYMRIHWEYRPVDDGVRMRWVQEFAVKPEAPMDDASAERFLNLRTRTEMAHIKLLIEAQAERQVFRVMLRMSIASGKEADFVRAWREIAESVSRYDANVGQWLMRSDDEAGIYYVISDWVDEASFREFERSERHLTHRRMLHPLRRSSTMITTRVVATRVKPVAG
jgi:heme-degrading monooxygenase HmoA/ribosome-associated toxin RatA of RatAB toxin-antitoxin module